MNNHVQHISSSSGNAVYCLGVIGAIAYYLQHAASFGDGLWGIFKGFFWPAFFVYKAIEMFHI